VRDAARARDEPINRASIRRSGLATTQRFDRAGSRGGRPNDWVEIPGPRRAWRGRTRPTRARMGWCTSDSRSTEGVRAETGPFRRDVIPFSVCALTPIRQREYDAFPHETQHANAAERSTTLCGIGRNAVRPNVLTSVAVIRAAQYPATVSRITCDETPEIAESEHRAEPSYWRRT
jgi:hypothetical protein